MGNLKMQPGTWFMAHKLVHDRLDIDANSRWVFTYIQRCASEYNATFPSYTKITKVCGISRPTVSKCLKELTAHGLLKIEERYDKAGRQLNNFYTIILPDQLQQPTVTSEEQTFLNKIKPLLEQYSYDELINIIAGNAVTKEIPPAEPPAPAPLPVEFPIPKEAVFSPPLPEEPPVPAPPTGEAKTYGHNGQIKLTTNEYIGLVNDYGADTVTDYIDQLDGYLASRGNQNKYKNHYATIRRWIVKGKKDELAKEAEAAAKTKEAAKPKRNRFANFKGRERDYAELERKELELRIREAEELKNDVQLQEELKKRGLRGMPEQKDQEFQDVKVIKEYDLREPPEL